MTRATRVSVRDNMRVRARARVRRRAVFLRDDARVSTRNGEKKRLF